MLFQTRGGGADEVASVAADGQHGTSVEQLMLLMELGQLMVWRNIS
jgi:hypothetical protein